MPATNQLSSKFNRRAFTANGSQRREVQLAGAVVISFHTTVHARPIEIVTGSVVEIAGRAVHPLAVSPESLATPFQLSFEVAAARLVQLDRLFFEPDGSFVWASPQAEQPWQIDGNLFDRNGLLLFVDLKGTCPPEKLDQLLSAFGWPETPIMFQLTREAVFLDEVEFRKFAAGKS